jgi:hypothetical protein
VDCRPHSWDARFAFDPSSCSAIQVDITEYELPTAESVANRTRTSGATLNQCPSGPCIDAVATISRRVRGAVLYQVLWNSSPI